MDIYNCQSIVIGNGGEILIEANLFGNVFVFGGLGLLAISVFRKH